MVVAAYAGPVSCEFRPDVDTAWLWLSWWFEFCTRGVIEIGWMNPVTGQLTQFRRFERTDISILKCIDDENSVPGQSMYVRAGTVDPASPVGRTRDEHILQAPGPWADLDTQEQVERARRVESMVRANGWTTTGAFPHVRYQLWVRASEPMITAGFIRDTNRQMQKLYGGDPSVANPSRLMRLPGTIAWPYKTGRIIELTKFELAPADRPRQYPMSTIRAMLPQLETTASVGAARVASDDDEWGGPVVGSPGGVSQVTAAIAEIKAGRQWHNGVVRLVASWIGRGWSNAEILLACEGLTLPGWTVGQTREEVAKAIEGARRKWNVPEPAGGLEMPAAPTGPPLALSPLRGELMRSTGMRQWVYGHFLVRGFVSVLGAPGGYGKTAYAQAVALAIVLGRDLLDEGMHEPGRVAVWNLEDPHDEIMRRCWAAIEHHEAEDLEVDGRLFLNSGRDRELVVARLEPKSGAVIATPEVEQLVAALKQHGITVLIVDPFVRSHRLSENDNDAMDFVAGLWARVARDANVAVLLLHHFRKGGQGGDADSFRGASALIDASRAAISLSRMTGDEAKDLKVAAHERWRYLKVENAKLNTAPPPEHAVWLRLVSVALPNGPGGGEGDNVQTVERWHPPSPFESLSMRELSQCLDAIEAGEGGEYFTKDRRGGDTPRWVGYVIQKHCHEPLTDRQAQVIINQWLRSGLLVEASYRNRDYKAKPCVRVDPSKKASIGDQATVWPKSEE